MTDQATQFDKMWIIIALALLMYVLPWIMNVGTTLSIGAYDLAELIAKRPLDGIGYYTVYALRAELMLITLLVSTMIRRPYFSKSWWLCGLLGLMLVVAQLPPLTYFANFNDINQQQQATLALVSFIGLSIGLSGLVYRFRHILRLVIGVVGILGVIYGLSNSINLLSDYAIYSRIGIGGIGLVIVYGLIALYSLFNIKPSS